MMKDLRTSMLYSCSSKKKRHWWVVVTRPNAEKKVSKGFELMGICHLLPLQMQIRQWHDRKKKIMVPIFGSYIFVQLAAEERVLVFELPGVLQYVSIQGQPVKVREEELEMVKRLCEQGSPVELEELTKNWQPGDKIKVTEGHFAGIEGYIKQRSGSNYFTVVLPGLQYFATVKLEAVSLKAI